MRPHLIQHLDVKLGEATQTGVERNYSCPFCLDNLGDESTKPTLGVNTTTGAWHCFRCDSGGGTVAKLLRDLNQGPLTVEDAAALAGDDTVVSPGRRKMVAEAHRVIGDAFTPPTSERVRLKTEPVPRVCVPLWEGDGRDLRTVRQFFLHRKAPYTAKEAERIIRRYRLYYYPNNARRERPDRRGHMVVPVMIGGRAVWYTTRATAPDAWAKSLNPTERPGHYTKENCLLGFDQALGAKTVAVVEGPFSMFAFATLPKALRRTTAAVALMGTTIHGDQVRLLRRLRKAGAERLVVATEPDKAKARDRIAGRVASVGLPTLILPLGDGDPDDEKRRLPELLDRARPYDRLSAAEMLLRAALTQRQK